MSYRRDQSATTVTCRTYFKIFFGRTERGSCSPKRFFLQLTCVREGRVAEAAELAARQRERRRRDQGRRRQLIVGPARDERCVVLSLSCSARLRPGYPHRYCTLRMPVAALGALRPAMSSAVTGRLTGVV
jgi:hypothetical protein